MCVAPRGLCWYALHVAGMWRRRSKRVLGGMEALEEQGASCMSGKVQPGDELTQWEVERKTEMVAVPMRMVITTGHSGVDRLLWLSHVARRAVSSNAFGGVQEAPVQGDEGPPKMKRAREWEGEFLERALKREGKK